GGGPGRAPPDSPDAVPGIQSLTPGRRSPPLPRPKPMPAPRRLVLIDGNSFLYRAFHALPPLTSSRGQPTGAIFGFINMLQKIRADHAPDLIGVVMDAPGPTF